MRFVVTGATSMIGASFVEAAVKEGHEILAIVRPNSVNLNRMPKSDLIKYEYFDLDHLDEVRGDGGYYDAIYHFAWGYTDREGRYNTDGQETNIRYTLKAVDLAHKLGISRFIGVGSQSEYGFVNGEIDKSTPLNPNMPYAMAKVSSYWLSKEKCNQYGIKHIWGRVFSIYGKHDHEGTLLLYAIDSFLRGEKAYFSSGLQTWNYLHESDAGRMFLLLGTKEIDSGVYFVANPHSLSLKTYLNELISCFDGSVQYEYASDLDEKAYGIFPNMKNEVEIIGFNPEISFKSGIKEMIEYRKSVVLKAGISKLEK